MNHQGTPLPMLPSASGASAFSQAAVALPSSGTAGAAGGGCGPLARRASEPPVEDAIQSLLGLAEASSGELQMPGTGSQSNWQASGSCRTDAVLRRRLTHSNVAAGRLRFPAHLFDLLFGQPAGGMVVLLAAGSTVGQCLQAQPVPGEGGGWLLQGDAVRQLFAAVGAELADTVQLQHRGCMPESGSAISGAPIAVCSLAEKASAAVRSASAAAVAAAAVVAAAAGPTPVQAVPLTAQQQHQTQLHLQQQVQAQQAQQVQQAQQAQQAQQQQQQQQQQAQLLAEHARQQQAKQQQQAHPAVAEEPAAPPTVRPADSLAPPPTVGPKAAAASPFGAAFPPNLRQGQDSETTAAAAALATAAAEEEEHAGPSAAGPEAAAGGAEEAAAGGEQGGDPEWQAKPKARGRPRKRRPVGAAAASAAASSSRQAADVAPLTCTHCGTSDTPRWWKDNFPIGPLCNACGIWLKRHGYPRPVQFFVNPAAAAAGGGTAAGGGAAGAAVQQQGGGTAELSSREPPADVEFYLINGRPKRRRASSGSGNAAAAAAAATAAAAAPQAEARGTPGAAGATSAGQQARQASINFEAAGSSVFVVRRKLIKAEGAADPTAALVHFGWAPGVRAAHAMFSAVACFGEGSAQVSVDDFELLSDVKATATLQLRPGASVPNWDSVVTAFVDSL